MHQTLQALVRGFFDGYFTGLLEARLPEGAKREPRMLKQLVAEQYGTVGNTFTQVMLPILLGLQFESYEAALADMQARRFTDSTPVKILLRYACGSKAAYEAVTAAYRQQMETLLSGHIMGVSEFLGAIAAEKGSENSENSESSESSESSEPSEAAVSSDHSEPSDSSARPSSGSLRALSHTVMTAYTQGLRAGGSTTLRQPTVLRLMADAAAALLHDKPFDVWADMDRIGLDGVYSRACRTQDNYETLLAEMSLTYEDLAQS